MDKTMNSDDSDVQYQTKVDQLDHLIKVIPILRLKAFNVFMALTEAEIANQKALLAHEEYVLSWKRYPPDHNNNDNGSHIVSVVTSLGNDGSFWCQIHSTQFEDNKTLHHINNTLKDHVKEVYTIMPNTGSIIPTPLFFYLSSKDIYMRCLVVNYSPPNKTVIRYLDLGILDEIPSDTQFFSLTQENITNFPFKCMFCVLPFEVDCMPYEAKWKFRDLTTKQTLKAKITGQKLHVGLIAQILLLKSMNGTMLNDEISLSIKQHEKEVNERKAMMSSTIKEASPKFKEPSPLMKTNQRSTKETAKNESTNSNDFHSHIHESMPYKEQYQIKSRSGSTSDPVDKNMGRSLDRNSCCSLDRNSNRSVDRNASRSVDRNANRSLDRNASHSVDRNASRSVDRSSSCYVDRNASRSVDRNASRSLDRNACRSLDRKDSRPLNGLMINSVDKNGSRNQPNETFSYAKIIHPNILINNPPFLSKSHDNLSCNSSEEKFPHIQRIKRRPRSISFSDDQQIKASTCSGSNEKVLLKGEHKLTAIEKDSVQSIDTKLENCTGNGNNTSVIHPNERRIKSRNENEQMEDHNVQLNCSKRDRKSNRSTDGLKKRSKSENKKKLSEKQAMSEQHIHVAEIKADGNKYWVEDIPLEERLKVQAVLPPMMNLEYKTGVLNHDTWDSIELYNVTKLLQSQAKIVFYWYDVSNERLLTSFKTHELTVPYSFFHHILSVKELRCSQYLILREYYGGVRKSCSHKLLGICKYEPKRKTVPPKIYQQKRGGKYMADIPITYLSLSMPKFSSKKWEDPNIITPSEPIPLDSAKAVVYAFQKSLIERDSTPVYPKIYPWCGIPPIINNAVGLQKINQGNNSNEKAKQSFVMKSGENWDLDESEKENYLSSNELLSHGLCSSENNAIQSCVPQQAVNASIEESDVATIQQNNSQQTVDNTSIIDNSSHFLRSILSETTNLMHLKQDSLYNNNTVNSFVPVKILRRNPNGTDGYIGEVWYPDISKVEPSYFPNNQFLSTKDSSLAHANPIIDDTTCFQNRPNPSKTPRQHSNPEVGSIIEPKMNMPSQLQDPATNNTLSGSADQLHIEESINRLINSPTTVSDYFQDNLDEDGSDEVSLERQCSTYNISREEID